MSKELEFLETIITTKELKPLLEQTKQALQRLEKIDNANPSEALESLENIEADLTGLPKHVTEYDDGFDNYLEDIWYRIDTIKQSLLTKSKKEQAFDIVIKLITSDNEDPELSMEKVLAVACAQTFGKQSEEFKTIKEVLNISEEEYADFVTKYCKKETEIEKGEKI